MIWIFIMIVVAYFLIKSAVRNGIIEAHNCIKEKEKNEKDKEKKDIEEKVKEERNKEEKGEDGV